MSRRRPTKRSIEFCGLESLESRWLMSGAAAARHGSSYIYTETDNSNPGQNAVIAFRQNAQGQVAQIGSFSTGGTGVANPQGLLGPDDSDKEVIASPDGRFLFAVNQGSNTIAEFRVRSNGTLALINDAAVSSGGTEPVSLSIANNRLYVVNRGDEIQGQTGSIAPTITVFNIRRTGVLTPDFADTVTLTAGLSPSALLISNSSTLAFLDTFTPPPLNNVSGANEVVPYQIGANGALTPVASGGLGDPVSPPLILGLVQHPTQNIIYAGLTGAAEVGVFTFDSAGDLTLADTVAVQGHGPCWTLVSPNGQFLYTSDTATDSVGVFSLANPLAPVQIQEFTLGGPHNSSGNPMDPLQTADYEFAMSPNGNTIYVIDHQTDAAGTFEQGNALHVLTVGASGMLSESASSPLFLPSNIPAGSQPQGVAIITNPGGSAL